MKILSFVLLLALSVSTSFGQSVGARDVEPYLQQMQASGKITAEQASITRKYMEQMKPADWQALEQKAQEKINRNPSAVQKLKEQGSEALNPSDFHD